VDAFFSVGKVMRGGKDVSYGLNSTMCLKARRTKKNQLICIKHTNEID